MRSKASYRGHPIHPALIPFPFAFLSGAVAFNVAGVVFEQPELWTTGAHLETAGVATGILAAIPGIVDFVFTVPPRSSGKKRARRHGIANGVALVLFALTGWLRGDAGVEPEPVLLAVQLIALASLTYAGWLGGTLVSRNQIGVDHRYANKGKWKDERARSEDGYAVVDGSDLELNQMKLVRVNDKRVVLARCEDGFVAFDDRCTHRGGSLAGGAMICGTVQCPWHGSQFDARTGEVRAGPAEERIACYGVDAADGPTRLRVRA